VVRAAESAGEAIRAVSRETMELTEKAEGAGPVTRADRDSDSLLREALKRIVPAAWLSEETADDPVRLKADYVWIVDPLDGTREFVHGVPEYAVAVGLARKGVPVLGVVHNPATGETVAGATGCGVMYNSQPVQVTEGTVLLASRSEIKRGEFRPFESSWDIQPVGSIQYKLALVAAGKGAVTFSRGPKHEWDVCAGAALVREAGGRVTDVYGDPIVFNQPRPKTRGVLAGAPAAFDRALTQIRETGASDRMAELD
jgi:myo-inositol-1(or 4)-monophosphatase